MPLPDAYPPGLDMLPRIDIDEYADLDDMALLHDGEEGNVNELARTVLTNNRRLHKVINASLGLQLAEEHLRSAEGHSLYSAEDDRDYRIFGDRLVDGGMEGHRFAIAIFTQLAIIRTRAAGVDELLNRGGAFTHLPIRNSSEERQVLDWLRAGSNDQTGWLEPSKHSVEASELLDGYRHACPSFDSLYVEELKYKKQLNAAGKDGRELETTYFIDGFEYGVAHGLCLYAISEQARLRYRSPQ